MNSNNQPEPKSPDEDRASLQAAQESYRSLPDAHPQPIVGDDELRKKVEYAIWKFDSNYTPERGGTLAINTKIPVVTDEIMSLVQAHTEAAVKEIAQFNWICQPDVCGAYNPYDCRRCRVCGKERPAIYTQIELDVAVREARIDELNLIDQAYGWKSIVTYDGFKKWKQNRVNKIKARLTKGGK
jgi:ribosomal protein L40E